MSDDETELTRRQFLDSMLRVGLAAGATGFTGVACRDDSPTAKDTFDSAMGEMLDGASDLGEMTDISDTTDIEDIRDIQEIYGQLSKPPFMQIDDTGESARLRFETFTQRPLEVRLESSGGMGTEKKAHTSTQQVDYRWPPGEDFPIQPDQPDKPGEFTVQEVGFDRLKAGEDYEWIIHLGEGKQVTGDFRAPPPRGAAFEMAFLSDTMHPKSADVGKLLAEGNPDVLLHGGDIQYQTNPLDTYNALFSALADVFKLAPTHFCVGNHEQEEHDEFDLFYRRLFAARRNSKPVKYHGFTYGGVRFLVLDSEDDFQKGSKQYQWLEKELSSAQSDSEIRYPVVAYHRPFFTFSESSPSFSTRDVFHPLFQKYGVRLVLNGHNHCYERFEADGITYVVDGGGGASLYFIDASKSEVLAERPEDENRHKASERSHGALFGRVNSDGSIDFVRKSIDGKKSDEFSVG